MIIKCEMENMTNKEFYIDKCIPFRDKYGLKDS